MALTPGKPAGSYFEFDQLCNEGATVVFRVREFLPPRYMEKTKNTVQPVLADLVVLTGAQAKTVARREDLIGSGIAPMLHRYDIGDDVVCVMSWGENKYGGRPYPQANPQPADTAAYQQAVKVFEATNGDPYRAAEQAANPTATLAPAQAAPALGAAAPVAAPQPPAPDAPAPWGAPPAAVGGPQGPGWGESPAAANAQPVASGSVW